MTLYFNVSTDLLNIKDYEEALLFCNLGIDLHKKVKSVKCLGELYGNKANALAFLGQLKENGS